MVRNQTVLDPTSQTTITIETEVRGQFFWRPSRTGCHLSCLTVSLDVFALSRSQNNYAAIFNCDVSESFKCVGHNLSFFTETRPIYWPRSAALVASCLLCCQNRPWLRYCYLNLWKIG